MVFLTDSLPVPPSSGSGVLNHLNGAVSWGNGVDPNLSSISGTIDNLSSDRAVHVIQPGANADCTVRGIVPGTNGQRLTIICSGGVNSTVRLVSQSTIAPIPNRLSINGTTSDTALIPFILCDGQGAEFIYSTALSRWVCLSNPQQALNSPYANAFASGATVFPVITKTTMSIAPNVVNFRVISLERPFLWRGLSFIEVVSVPPGPGVLKIEVYDLNSTSSSGGIQELPIGRFRCGATFSFSAAAAQLLASSMATAVLPEGRYLYSWISNQTVVPRAAAVSQNTGIVANGTGLTSGYSLGTTYDPNFGNFANQNLLGIGLAATAAPICFVRA